MQVNLDSRQIEQAMVSAIIDSSLGDVIKEEVQKAIDGLLKDQFNRRSPIRIAVEAEIQRIVLLLLREEYGEKMRDAVREKLTDDAIAKAAGAAIDAFHEKLQGR